MVKKKKKSEIAKIKANYKIKDHQLYLSTWKVLYSLFRKNSYDKSKRWKVFKIFFWASLTQFFMFLERLIYNRKIKKVDVNKNPPIFILGHWRSGTTHLHYLVNKDPQIGSVSNYHSYFINVLLLTKGWLVKVLAPFMPKKRPMDNVKMTIYDPQEEDQAIGNFSPHIGIHSFYFPKNRSYFRKYTLLRDCTPKERKAWERDYNRLMQIITLANDGKRLVIKNPANTGRSAALAQLYPEAKFIFIHRNPYEIYKSTLKLYVANTSTQFLQEISEQELKDIIFENYVGVMRQYMEQREAIPESNRIEIRFTDLMDDSEGTMKRIYEELGLPGWKEALPHIREYLSTVKNYTPNKHEPLPEDIVKRIQEEWAFSFEEWDYDWDHELVPESRKPQSPKA